MDRFKKKYLEEANELTTKLESALLGLDINNYEEGSIQEIFRIMHTIKGNSAMFGYKRIEEFTHHIESIYDLVRNNKATLSKGIMDFSLLAIDHINVLLEYENDLPEELNSKHEALLKQVVKLAEDVVEEKKAEKPNEVKQPEKEVEIKSKEEKKEETIVIENKSDSKVETTTKKEEFNVFYINFEPKPEIFKFGNNPLFLIEDITKLGKSFVYPKFEKIPELKDITPDLCFVSWDIILYTNQDINAIKDIFIFAEDDCIIAINEMGKYANPDNLIIEKYNIIGNNAKHLDIEVLNNILKNPSYEIIAELKQTNSNNIKEEIVVEVKEEIVIPEPIVEVIPKIEILEPKVEKTISKIKDTEACKKTNNKPDAISKHKDAAISSIRVSSDKLDSLMNLISEMVTLQARLSLYAQESKDTELSVISENLEKVSRLLRDNAFSICLIPLESIITQFQRLVRDVSAELKKDVQFITKGTDTELDKNIIESLGDPIMHILRNSLDHGIESAEKRAISGKPIKGTIKLEAFYSGTNVYIEISDDGGGINTDKVREKAIQKGLITQESTLSHKELLELIFASGLSTASAVTGLSGRGVGMDVVKRKIKDIRGDVEIESQLGEGTKITIKLPLTLSIIDGLLVQIGNTLYIIPLTVVNFIFSAPKSSINKYNDLIVHNGEELPYIYLRDEFKEQDDDNAYLQFVVVNYKDFKVGLVIDKVIGEYQAVLKPIGKLFKEQDFISGATILGDGTIALVLDTTRIVKEFASKQMLLNQKQA